MQNWISLVFPTALVGGLILFVWGHDAYMQRKERMGQRKEESRRRYMEMITTITHPVPKRRSRKDPAARILRQAFPEGMDHLWDEEKDEDYFQREAW